jgi:hypothetical protein
MAAWPGALTPWWTTCGAVPDETAAVKADRTAQLQTALGNIALNVPHRGPASRTAQFRLLQAPGNLEVANKNAIREGL